MLVMILIWTALCGTFEDRLQCSQTFARWNGRLINQYPVEVYLHEYTSYVLDSLGRQEEINRQKRFAFTTLLYEIGYGKKPFEWLSNEKVQQRYSNAEFPNDVKTLPPPLFALIRD